jgi:hypothetical protein
MTTERDQSRAPAGTVNGAVNGTARPADPAPFVRRQVQWGRPPSTVFHAGPLPKGPAMSPLAEPAPVRTAPQGVPRTGSILQGSMIPTAAPRKPVVSPSEPEWVEEALTAPVVAAPVIPAPRVEAARPVRAPEPVRREVLDPLPVPPSKVEPVGAAAPVAVEAPVAPAYAKTKAQRPSRTPLYVGAAVVVLALAAGGVWMATRSSAPEAPVAATAPAAAIAPAAESTVIETAPVATTPVAETPAVTAPAPAATRPATTTVRTPPAPVAATPRGVQRPPVATSPTSQPAAPPAITVQPLVVTPPPVQTPPPTAARTAPVDPDAPISTRPQPLD